MQEGTRRLLVEDSAGQAATATAGTKASGGKLSVQCQALVSLAEPGNLYKAFQDSFTATGVATQAKYLEQKLNLPVCSQLLTLGQPFKGSPAESIRWKNPAISLVARAFAT